jgi:hypothetical protein
VPEAVIQHHQTLRGETDAKDCGTLSHGIAA